MNRRAIGLRDARRALHRARRCLVAAAFEDDAEERWRMQENALMWLRVAVCDRDRARSEPAEEPRP